MEIVQRLFLIALGLPEITALFLAYRKTKNPYLLTAFIRASIFTVAYVILVLFGVDSVRDAVRILFVLMQAVSFFAAFTYIREVIKK